MKRLTSATAPDTPLLTSVRNEVASMKNKKKRPSSYTKGRHNIRLSRFVFVLNNYTMDDIEDLKKTSSKFKWMIFQEERCPTTGTPHLQGAAIIGKQMAQSTVEKLPGFSRAWIASMRGTPPDSLRYCSKPQYDENGKQWFPIHFESGTMPKEGKRNDLEDTIEALRTGTPFSHLVHDNRHAIALVRYPRGLTLLRSLYTKVRNPEDPPKVFWFYGESGTHKTRTAWTLSQRTHCLAFEEDKENICHRLPWMSSGSLQWFTGYENHPVAIFDDFRAKHVEFAFLLRLLDRYPVHVQIKNGDCTWAPEYIFITTTKTPAEMWSFRSPEQILQLERRICSIVKFPISEETGNNLLSAVGARTSSDFRLSLESSGLWNAECSSTWNIRDTAANTEKEISSVCGDGEYQSSLSMGLPTGVLCDVDARAVGPGSQPREAERMEGIRGGLSGGLIDEYYGGIFGLPDSPGYDYDDDAIDRYQRLLESAGASMGFDEPDVGGGGSDGEGCSPVWRGDDRTAEGSEGGVGGTGEQVGNQTNSTFTGTQSYF